MEPIQHWRILIGGFLQHEGRPSGIGRLWRYVHSAMAAPGTVVDLKSWSDNWNHAAEWIYRLRNGTTPDIRIMGYSWGGMSATLLARALAEHGLTVRHLVLCDAVYRHRYKLGQWRALLPGSQIVVPANVLEVHWLRQLNPRFDWRRRGSPIQPAGHDVVAESRRTCVHAPIILDCEHHDCDDTPEFHQLALDVCTR